jgi:hypothetical protein
LCDLGKYIVVFLFMLIIPCLKNLPVTIFSPTIFPGLPSKTPTIPNTGYIAVTNIQGDRHIGVFKIYKI